jgi:phenolic acid decarboxylase
MSIGETIQPRVRCNSGRWERRVPTIERDWEVTIAGEGNAIGTVRATDEATARSLAIELAETHSRNVGAAFDPKWVHVRAPRPEQSV